MYVYIHIYIYIYVHIINKLVNPLIGCYTTYWFIKPFGVQLAGKIMNDNKLYWMRGMVQANYAKYAVPIDSRYGLTICRMVVPSVSAVSRFAALPSRLCLLCFLLPFCFNQRGVSRIMSSASWAALSCKPPTRREAGADRRPCNTLNYIMINNLININIHIDNDIIIITSSNNTTDHNHNTSADRRPDSATAGGTRPAMTGSGRPPLLLKLLFYCSPVYYGTITITIVTYGTITYC